MCGCNDINALPGHMGAHGHEGDGGCECAGLTVRGRHWLLFGDIDSVRATRRQVSEQLNFPPLLAFVNDEKDSIGGSKTAKETLLEDHPAGSFGSTVSRSADQFKERVSGEDGAATVAQQVQFEAQELARQVQAEKQVRGLRQEQAEVNEPEDPKQVEVEVRKGGDEENGQAGADADTHADDDADDDHDAEAEDEDDDDEAERAPSKDRHESAPHLASAPSAPSFFAPPTRAFHSAIGAALPPNVKLVTLTSNYAAHNGGKWLLRLAHLYSVNEHPVLSQPVQVDLAAVFSKPGMRIISAAEVSLTANQPIERVDGRKHAWRTYAENERLKQHLDSVDQDAVAQRVPFSFPLLTIRPMEVRTFLATFA